MENNIKLLSKEIPIYVSAVFYKYIKPELVYHNLEHTIRVVERTLEIVNYYKLGATERFILLAASWFHDTGHLFPGLRVMKSIVRPSWNLSYWSIG